MKKTDPQTLLDKTSELADKGKDVIESTGDTADSALDAVKDGIETLREQIPEKIATAAAELKHLKCAGVNCAKHACNAVKENLEQVGKYSTSYIRDNPGKSLLIAALSGAAVAGLVNYIVRSSSRSR